MFFIIIIIIILYYFLLASLAITLLLNEPEYLVLGWTQRLFSRFIKTINESIMKNVRR